MSDSGERPWTDLPTDELAEVIASVRKDAAGPDGMCRVRLPDGANVFVVDPASHLVVLHAAVVVRLADVAEGLRKRVVALEGRRQAEENVDRLVRSAAALGSLATTAWGAVTKIPFDTAAMRAARVDEGRAAIRLKMRADEAWRVARAAAEAVAAKDAEEEASDG